MNKLFTTLFLVVVSITGGARSQSTKNETASETQLILSVIDERQTILEDEIPKIEKKLKKSREDYQQLLTKVPKGYNLICGDSVSIALEQQLTKYRSDIKSLQNEKKRYEVLAKSKKAEQDAAANP